MDKAIYTAMSGASQTMLKQQVHANNMANVNTSGFRADYANVVAKNVAGEGLQTRALSEVTGTWSSEQAGNIMQTGRELDVAIAGEGWMAVQDNGGEEAYTRGGSLMVNPDGLLMNNRGMPVLDDGGAVIAIPPYQSLQIGSDGTISVRGAGEAATQSVVVGKIKLSTSDVPLQKSEDGLFRSADRAPLDDNPLVKVESGALESSNVNAMEEMVTFMSLGRQFEMQLKTIETARQMAESGDRLIRGS